MPMRLNVLNWSTDVNGLGKSYRKMFRIPRGLYLPFNSDHGLATESFLEKHELDAVTNIHFTWNKCRYRHIKDGSKKAMLCPCPLTIYLREINKLNNSCDKRGTLIFLPHTNFGFEHHYDVISYLHQILDSDNFEAPYKVIIHPTDVKKGLLEHVGQKFQYNINMKIRSLGSNLDYHFLDRFYDETNKYKYATSSQPGTELFLCHEIGIEYKIMGVPPKKTILNNSEWERQENDSLRIQSFDEIYRAFDYLQIDESWKTRVYNDLLSMDLYKDDYLQELRSLIMRDYRKTLVPYLRGKIAKAV
jgi:hypothetical protein